MPKIAALGGMSSRGFGEFAQQTSANYIEDVFSTYLYTGNGTSQTITNNINLGDANVFSNTSTTALPAATNRSWTSLTYGNSNFFAVSYQAAAPFVGNRFAYSTDGITWSSNTTAPNATWVGSAFGNGRFVAVSQGITGYPATAVYSSTASGTFATATGFPNITTNNVRWVNDRFIAAAQGGTTMAYSTTGTSWTSMTVPTGDWYDVAYGNGKWVCVSQTSSACITSTNGTTWTQSGTSISAYTIAFGNGIFVATGNNNTYTSSDGVTWTTVTSSCPINNGFQIIFDGTYFVVAGNSSSGVGIAYSTNATSWTFRPAPTATFNGGTEAFVAYSGTRYAVITRTTQNYSATVDSLVPATFGNGGLVWMKGRSGATDHALYDTARGATFDLVSNTTAAQTTQSTGLTGFSASGFSIGSLAKINTSASTYVSWTFRKQPKFFDVVTWTGNGIDNRKISHNLGSVPGMIIVKDYAGTGAGQNWRVWQRSANAGSGNGNAFLTLNLTNAATVDNGLLWGTGSAYVAPTATDFTISGQTSVNGSGIQFVAYVFAHDAGGFGADGSQNVISCGSFTTDASGNATVNLGYEPQWLLYKASSTTSSWFIQDNMRGFTASSASPFLNPNLANAESPGTSPYVSLTSTGFVVNGANFGLNNATIIYMAIRRGPMKTPTSGTSVFIPLTYTGVTNTARTTGFPIDLQLSKVRTNAISNRVYDRLRGVQTSTTAFNTPTLFTNNLDAETAASGSTNYWNNTGYLEGSVNNTYSVVDWNFRRAPGFMDTVCYTGTSSNNSVSHNLGVTPEFMIIKRRSGSQEWLVGSSYNWANSGYLMDDSAFSAGTGSVFWNTPTSSSVTLLGGASQTNSAGSTYVMYLFATCPGVSKVGSYTGTGATQTISCGFTGGARYVLIKRTNSTGSWFVWDNARGMVAGTDPRLAYNSNAAETNANWVYTTTGGFQIVTSDATVNASGGTYIYLAIS